MSLPLPAVDREPINADTRPSPVSERMLIDLAHQPPSSLAASTLNLANVLQSTLELNQLIELFNDEVTRVVPHQGMEYLNEEHSIRITHGREAPHSYSYDVVVLNKSLGIITLRRDEPLSERDTLQLEALICALVYPLRNALTYKQALDTALRDPVTGLNNRAALNSTIEREVSLAHRHGNALSVIMLDIDYFKRINDNYGHLTGDLVLRMLARRVLDHTRGCDIVFRYGGEEFTIVLSNTDIHGASLLAERIRAAVAAAPITHNDFDIPVTVSLGVATLEGGDTALNLIHRADAALYEAKSAGRNQVKIQTGA